MYRKVVLALMLVLHYSLAFGAIESAAMPDEHHPFGKAVPHSHLHHHLHQNTQDHRHDPGIEHGHNHEHQHSHTITMQLNIDVPGVFAVDFFKPDIPSITPYQLDHYSLSYAPAVPPPVKL